MDKKFLTLGMIVGGLVGGYIPSLWGANELSAQGIIFGGIGSLLGLYIMFKWTRGM